LKIAILLFDRLTALDAIGPYEVLSRLPGAEVVFVGKQRGEVRTDTGTLGLSVDRSLEEVGDADIVLVPGGAGTRPLLADEQVLAWLRQIDSGSKWTTSVCTGSLVLAAAGLLDGKRAACHWLWREHLSAFGAEPNAERVVFQGKLATAAGVSAGIDMALELVQREAGDEVAQAIQLEIEYDPQPPFDAGSPEKADPAIVELLRRRAQSDPALQIRASDP
jgi:transcriptional regulator GlxA family with amidase domain